MSIICIIFGGLCIFLSIYTLLFARKSGDFPGVVAEVTLSKVEIVRTADHKLTKRPKLIFSYNVDGKDYSESPHIYAYNSSSIEKQVAKYPVGSKHIVSYNPENPKQIMLKNNISFPGLAALFLFGVALILIGLQTLGVISIISADDLLKYIPGR
jgi:hypothetical protein